MAITFDQRKFLLQQTRLKCVIKRKIVLKLREPKQENFFLRLYELFSDVLDFF